MIYKIINPSDALTLEADVADEALAGLAIIILSKGNYGLTDANDVTVCPIFAFSCPERLVEWLGDRNISNGSADEFILANGDKLATILESVVYGNVSDRRLLVSAMAAMEPAVAAQYLAEWNDTKRSSMTNIRAKALELASHLRQRAKH